MKVFENSMYFKVMLLMLLLTFLYCIQMLAIYTFKYLLDLLGFCTLFEKICAA